jgi:rod shape-determining protein MreB and related proteins
MLRGIIKSTLYVRVSRNKLHVRHIKSGRSVHVTSDTPFTTNRLLMGDFLAAEAALRKACAEVQAGPKYLAAPRVVMHPLEMVEGGLSGVENRVFMEVADCAGAERIAVWVGHELSDQEVLERFTAA